MTSSQHTPLRRGVPAARRPHKPEELVRLGPTQPQAYRPPAGAHGGSPQLGSRPLGSSRAPAHFFPSHHGDPGFDESACTPRLHCPPGSTLKEMETKVNACHT